MEKICIIGCWHQGVVGAACLADLGFEILATDSDHQRIANLQMGKAPLYEPGLDDLLLKGLKSGTLRFTPDVAAAVRSRPYVFLMFDTPVDENDKVNTSVILRTAEEIAPHLQNNVILLVTAQVPVGTCDEIKTIINLHNPSLAFGIAYSPENLRLGQAIERFLHPPLPVLGSDDPSVLDRLEAVLTLLAPRWERVGLRTAEMTKHALNAFLGTSICFANELGNICDEVGADGYRIAEVLRLEPRIGPKAMLFPGLGFSGGTLARDMQILRSLGDRFDLTTSLLDGAWHANQQQNNLVIRKLKKALGVLTRLDVAVLGLTYKPGTSTLRRSASLGIIGDLVRENMLVHAHDPKADREEVASHKEFVFEEDVYRAVEACHAIVIITGWPEYKTLDFERIRKSMATPLILDTNNMLPADRLVAMGFTYMAVGRGR